MTKRKRALPSDGSSKQEWVRGPSTLPDIFDPHTPKKHLIWKNGQPVGPPKHPSQYTETLGILMSKSRKFDWRVHWDLQPAPAKEWLWTSIQDYWEVDDTRKEHTLVHIGSDTFRNRKSNWKRYNYSVHTTYEERIEHIPEYLSREEWVKLVEFWDTPEQKVISARNKANRALQIAKHTTGRTSFPQLMEKINQEEGAPPLQGEFYVITHTSQKTNGPLDELSREYIDKMRDIAGRNEEGVQQPLTDEIYSAVKPKNRHGRVRMMGRGVTLSSLNGSRASTSSGNNSNRMQELESEMAEMRRENQEIVEESQRELDEIRKQAQEKEEELRRELLEMKKQAQEKEDERQREIEEMKNNYKSDQEALEARLMQKFLDMVPKSNKKRR